MMWPTTTASCRLYFPPNSNRSGSSDLMDSTKSYITMRRQFIMQDVNLYFSFGRPEEGNKLLHSFGETNNNNNNNNNNNRNNNIYDYDFQHACKNIYSREVSSQICIEDNNNGVSP